MTRRDVTPWRRAALSCLVLGLGASAAAASTVAVQGARVHTGSWAARIDVERTCSVDDRTVPDGTDYAAASTEDGCVSVTAHDVDVLPGAEVTFRGGERIVLGSGFSVGAGASFRAVVGPQATGAAFVESRHPQAEPEYWARFYLDLDDLTLPGGETLLHLVAADGNGQAELAVGIRRDPTLGNRLFVRATKDDGSTVSTEGAGELTVPAGWHAYELRWRASGGAADGVAEICLDDSPDGGTACAALTGLDNDTGRIETVRWGALEVPAAPGLGTLYLDDFHSRTTGPVGPCGSAQTCP